MTFPRLLHLLAHHPDFEMTHPSIVEMSRSAEFASSMFSDIEDFCYYRYIRFYALTVATADNVSLLFHLAEKLKTIRDAESDQYSEVCILTAKLPPSIDVLFLSAFTP